MLELVRRMLPEALVAGVLSFLRSSGQLLVIVGGLLVLLYSLIYAIKLENFRIFGMGVIGILVLALLQYVSKRFFEGCDNIIKSTPSTMASAAVLDCIALIAVLASVGTLIMGIYTAIDFRQFAPFITGLGTSLILLLLTGVCLRPNVLTIGIAPASAGEEAMGVLAFFMKIPVVLVPAYFFILALFGVVITCFAIFGSNINLPIPALAGLGNAFDGVAGLGALIVASVLPFITYIVFLLSYLAVDVVRSIVCLPGKVDALRRNSDLS